MVKKIENFEIMTVAEFKEKYSDKRFIYRVIDSRSDAEYMSSTVLDSEVTWVGDYEGELIPIMQKEIESYKSIVTGIT